MKRRLSDSMLLCESNHPEPFSSPFQNDFSSFHFWGSPCRTSTSALPNFEKENYFHSSHSAKKRKQVYVMVTDTLQQHVYNNDYFRAFPRELYAIIFSFLPLHSLVNVFRVCKAFGKQSENEYLWKLLHTTVSPISWSFSCWKSLYRAHVMSQGLQLIVEFNRSSLSINDFVVIRVTLQNRNFHNLTLLSQHASIESKILQGSLFVCRSVSANASECDGIDDYDDGRALSFVQQWDKYSGSQHKTTILAHSALSLDCYARLVFFSDFYTSYPCLVFGEGQQAAMVRLSPHSKEHQLSLHLDAEVLVPGIRLNRDNSKNNPKNNNNNSSLSMSDNDNDVAMCMGDCVMAINVNDTNKNNNNNDRLWAGIVQSNSAIVSIV